MPANAGPTVSIMCCGVLSAHIVSSVVMMLKWANCGAKWSPTTIDAWPEWPAFNPHSITQQRWGFSSPLSRISPLLCPLSPLSPSPYSLSIVHFLPPYPSFSTRPSLSIPHPLLSTCSSFLLPSSSPSIFTSSVADLFLFSCRSYLWDKFLGAKVMWAS